tara:strand:- start:7858 stop:7992 length:135 start_codon:yes stop_codon:yes gene_type:complete
MGASHTTRALEHGSFWEYVKMRTGLLKRRTLSECFSDWMKEKGK